MAHHSSRLHEMLLSILRRWKESYQNPWVTSETSTSTQILPQYNSWPSAMTWKASEFKKPTSLCLIRFIFFDFTTTDHQHCICAPWAIVDPYPIVERISIHNSTMHRPYSVQHNYSGDNNPNGATFGSANPPEYQQQEIKTSLSSVGQPRQHITITATNSNINFTKS